MRRLHIDGVPPTHGWYRVRHELDNDPEWQAIRAICPELAHGEGKRALYVGASRWRCFLLDDLLRGGYKTDVLEIDEENCRQVAAYYPEARVIQGDIAQQYRLPDYDMAVWAHGPEHVLEWQATDTVSRLAAKCRTVLLAYPVDQEELDGVAYGNQAESHLWSIPTGWADKLGFMETSTGDDRVAAIWRRQG